MLNESSSSSSSSPELGIEVFPIMQSKIGTFFKPTSSISSYRSPEPLNSNADDSDYGTLKLWEKAEHQYINTYKRRYPHSSFPRICYCLLSIKSVLFNSKECEKSTMCRLGDKNFSSRRFIWKIRVSFIDQNCGEEQEKKLCSVPFTFRSV